MSRGGGGVYCQAVAGEARTTRCRVTAISTLRKVLALTSRSFSISFRVPHTFAHLVGNSSSIIGLTHPPSTPATSPARSISPLLSPLSRAPLHATITPVKSPPFTSPTTSFPPTQAHERAISILFKVVTLANLAFAHSGNKHHHHPLPDLSKAFISYETPPRQPWRAATARSSSLLLSPSKAAAVVRGEWNLLVVHVDAPKSHSHVFVTERRRAAWCHKSSGRVGAGEVGLLPRTRLPC